MKFHPSIARTRHASPLGDIVIAATDVGLAGLWFVGQRHMPDTDAWPDSDSLAIARETRRQLDAYFAGRLAVFDLPLDLRGGTPFQQSVWQALLDVRAGATTSYGELAARIGRPAAARAVGAAVGRNPVSIVVPCHRVIGSAGALTGYAGGLARKRELLRLEGLGQPAAPLRSPTSRTPLAHARAEVAR